jgi:Glycosyltransferases involved in cell wall biogenesis
MKNRPERNITKNWKKAGPPEVSVVCTAFNQEGILRDAVEGFLAQETDFPFEIIIHDDASTDRTPEIIREYVALYPNLVKPIFQVKNQYATRKKVTPIAVAQSEARFIAMCEGDDYWTSPRKLQYQLERMLAYPGCGLSFHPVFDGGAPEKEPTGILSRHAAEEKVFPTSEIIRGDGGFCPTGSLMLKRAVFDRLPDWFFEEAPVGDYFIQVYASLEGGALYLPEPMAAYRTFHPGSWSDRMTQMGNFMSFYRHFVQSLDLMNEDLGHRYDREIRHVKAMHHLVAANTQLRANHLDEFRELISLSWKTQPLVARGQVSLFLLRPFPTLARAFRRWRDNRLAKLPFDE